MRTRASVFAVSSPGANAQIVTASPWRAPPTQPPTRSRVPKRTTSRSPSPIDRPELTTPTRSFTFAARSPVSFTGSLLIVTVPGAVADDATAAAGASCQRCT